MSISTRTPPVPSRWADLQRIKDAQRKRNRRTGFYISAGVLAALLMSIGVWELIRIHRAHVHQQFVDSIKNDPRQLHDAHDAKKITDDEYEQMRRDAFEEWGNKRMDTYFAMSPADRKQWMDSVVTRVAEHEKQRQDNGPSTRPGG